MTSDSALNGIFEPRLLALAVFIAALTVYAAIDLAGRIRHDRGRGRWTWCIGGAIALGFGGWAIQYTVVEAFRLPVPVFYAWPASLISLLAAIVACGVTLLFISRRVRQTTHLLLATFVIGASIVAMHFCGISAMRLRATTTIGPFGAAVFVGLSFLVTLIGLRLTASIRDTSHRWGWKQFGIILMLGLALPAINCVGLLFTRFVPSAAMNGSVVHAVSASSLDNVSIAITSLMVLGIVFLSTTVARKFSLQTQQLVENQAQLQVIFDNMKGGIAVIDRQRNVVRVNNAATQMLGLVANAPFGSIFENFEMYSPEGEPLPPAQWPSQLALAGSYVQDFATRVYHKETGKVFSLEVTTAPICDREGNASQIIISYRDVTGHRHLDFARARLAAIVESSEDAIIGKDLEGKVTSWNRGAEKIFGYTSDEILGDSIRRLVPPDLHEEEDGILSRIRRGENVEHIETVRRRKNGELIHVSLTISPIRDASGTIVGASKIARDITERKQLERQLRQSHKMEAIGQLTGGIAHDFNNLLGVILGNLDLLANLVEGNDPALKRVRTAQKAVAHGADLTRRMLMFSRKEDLKPRPITLDESIQNMIELAGRGVGPEIRITPYLDPSVPPVFVDVAGLESALLNLVVNARDAMPKGGSISITTQLSHLEDSYPPVQTGEIKAGSYACVSVSDTGVGMSRDVLDRVFEPFFTTKSRNKGTGLGLSMVYGFVKQSGGTVRIYSEPGYGTTVSFYLPLANDRVEVAALPADGVPRSNRGGLVLVVDDEDDLLEIAVAYLQDMGYTPLHAANGAEALSVLQNNKVDLMITDIIMPGGMNGVELVLQSRELSPETRFIYCSGFPADALAERSLPLLDGPLLHKPYHRAEFCSIVRNVMEREPTHADKGSPVDSVL